VDIVIAGIAVVAFAACVFVFTGVFSGQRREPIRVASDPYDEHWMSVSEVAAALETSEEDVLDLVDRRAIPFFVVPGARRPDPAAYRFRRDEIDNWTIG
jgi:excisionase family DNA binding protein